VGGLAAGAEGFAGGNGACGETPEEATAGTGGAAGLAVRGFGAVGFGIVAAGEPPSEGFPAAGNGGTASVLGTLAGGGVGFWGPAEHRAWLRRIRTVRTCTDVNPPRATGAGFALVGGGGLASIYVAIACNADAH
jgi:hypothetical protein